ncbi:protein YhfH [Siminovitchia fortis]|uniref:YhfH family protein n=1 Tax=Siminovitchia fortis TaxID=254758 RepID=A0A443IP28_9BACI|nr:protein YhfH [Siminovitchia fortis]RWR08098.1 YhfH family protein [Siminovitchia fortis]WHY81054.1 protein YhfH [Siminovitchia fortis]
MLPIEFYRNIPAKQCCQCGEEMHEMHECYFNECERCLSKAEE